jgi:hypothetical protein
MGTLLILLPVMALQSGAAAPPALECPSGTTPQTFRYSSGSSAHWCVGANGLKHGPTRSYYANGQPLSSGEYLAGATHAAATYHHNDGTVWRRDEWMEGALVSKWLNPESMALSPEQLERLGAVGGGNDVGTSIRCGPGSRTECLPMPPKPVHVLRYSSGPRRARGSSSEGERTDAWSFWYPSGALAKRAAFFGGQLSGPYQEWYPNGRPSAEGEYLSGEKVGVWLYWDAAGKIRRERYGT